MTETGISEVSLEEVFKTVRELSNLIEQIASQIEEVMRRQDAIVSAVNQDKRKNDELELLNDDIRKKANLIRIRLNSMQKNLPVDENANSSSVIQRIQKNQYSYLIQWFSEVMRGHHNAQIEFREKCRAHIQRQLEIVNKVTTDEELEEMLHSDNLAVFVSNISTDGRITRQALTEIESRHQTIISLESSIKELHDIFTDTAMLLESQGGLIDSIERNVNEAAEYVDESKAETQKAVAFKKNPYKIGFLPNFFKHSKQ